MVLEVVDKMCIAAMKVARIVDIIDNRIHLKYEGQSLNQCLYIGQPTRYQPILITAFFH